MGFGLKLGEKLARLGIKAGGALRAVSPELCLAGSILFGIGCVVTSCIATVKSEPEVKKGLDTEESLRRDEAAGEGERALVPLKDLSKEDQRAIHDIRRRMAIVVVKNFAVPALLGMASIALNVHGHDILRRRLAETTLSLAAMTQTLNEYRKRVIEDQGAEKDQEYMHGIKASKRIDIDENGNVVKEEDSFEQTRPGISQYARMFDEGDWDDVNKRWIHHNPCWKDDAFVNLKNLRAAEREMNQKLVIDGFLFLNDVYRRLGLPLSIDGQIVGWTYNGPSGDHAVSFGVFDDDPRQLPCNRRFIAGETPNALLDFNVDGPIINELERFFGKSMAMKLIAQRM